MYPHPPINGLQAFLAHSLALQKSQNRRSRRFCVFVFYLYPYGVPIQAERDICRCESQYGFNCRPAGLASNKALIIARAAGQTIICWCGKHCCWSHPLVRTKAPAVTCHPVDLLPVGQYMRIMFALGWNTSLPCGQWWYFIFLPVSSLYFETVSTYWQFQGCVMGKTREGGRWKENRRRDVFDGDSRRWGNQKTQQFKSKDSKDTTIKIKRLKRHNNENQKTQKTQQSKSKDTATKIKRHNNILSLCLFCWLPPICGDSWLRQSKALLGATAGNQKHPRPIKEPFSAIAVHTHKERKVHLPCVLVEDQPTLHACYQTRAHCGRRKIIVEIHHPALMSSSAEGGGATTN